MENYSEKLIHHLSNFLFFFLVVQARGGRTLFFTIYVFFVVSCQLGCAESKSDVCQIVGVEHFFLGHKIQNGCQKLQFSVNNIENIEFRPQICIEDNLKLNINLCIADILVPISLLYLS